MRSSSKPGDAPTESTSLTGTSPADAPKKSRRSLTSIAITALPNFATEYNYNAISWAMLWIAPLYGSPKWADQLAHNSIFAGTLIGMVSLGYVGDVMGRNRAMTITLSLMATGSLLSGLLPWGGDTTVWVLLIIARFITGIGSGGVYPLSAAKAREDAVGASKVGKAQAAAGNLVLRTPAVIWVYFFGLLLVLGIGKGADFDMDEQPYNASWDAAWRIYLIFGALPVFPLIFLAARQPESSEVAKAKASQSKSTLELLREGGWGRQMIATGGAWFCYDASYYGSVLLQPKVIAIMYPDDTIETKAFKNMGVACFGLVFSILTVYLLPLGTKQLQVGSLLLSGAFSLALGAVWMRLYEAESEAVGYVQLLLYCLLYGTFWITKVTCYVLPSETYRVEVRSTLNGISSALGKLGAITGSYLFAEMLNSVDRTGMVATQSEEAYTRDENLTIQSVLYASACFSASGAVLTLVGLRMLGNHPPVGPDKSGSEYPAARS